MSCALKRNGPASRTPSPCVRSSNLYIRPLFCQGIGPFRWIAVSGNPQDIYTIDDMIKEEFSSNHPIVSWIEKAREHVHFTGLPARIGWLGYGERSRLGLLVNEAVASGKISGPIVFTRDHLDSGSAAMPHRKPRTCATAPTPSRIGRCSMRS